MPPLSDHDRAALARIEAQLAIDEPDLAHQLATGTRPLPVRIRRRVQLIVLVAGLALSILIPTLISLLR